MSTGVQLRQLTKVEPRCFAKNEPTASLESAGKCAIILIPEEIDHLRFSAFWAGAQKHPSNLMAV